MAKRRTTTKFPGALQLLFISDEGLFPASYIRAINLFAEPLKDRFAYKHSGQVTATEILTSEVVVFQRCRSNRAMMLFMAARAARRHVVYDIDDYLLDLPEESATAADFSEEQVGNICLMISLADLVTCSTPPLAQRLSRLNRRTVVVTNSVEPRRQRTPPTTGPVRLLVSNTDYFKLTSSKAAFLAALRDVLRKRASAQLVVVGESFPEAEALRAELGDRVVIHRGFIPDYNEYLRRVESIGPNIGLVPLEASEFHSFKSTIKYLDLAAFGVPGIFSDVVPYRGAIRHEETGLLAPNTRAGWFQAIDRLVANTNERKQIGAAALVDVSKNFSASSRLQQWQKLIKRLASTPVDAVEADRAVDAIMSRVGQSLAQRRSLSGEVTRRLAYLVPPHVPDGTLIRDPAGRVYVLETGYRRYIVSPTVFAKHGYQWSNVRSLGWLKMKLIPDGAPLEE